MVKRINQGQRLRRDSRGSAFARRACARLPYLAPVYGPVEWAVNGIFKQYTGWYDFNPTNLNPGSSSAFTRALIEAAKGSAPFVKRAQQAMRDGQWQLVLDLTSVILAAEPTNSEAHSVRA